MFSVMEFRHCYCCFGTQRLFNQLIKLTVLIIAFDLFFFRSHSRDESSADTKSRSHHIPGYGLQVSEQQSSVSLYCY